MDRLAYIGHATTLLRLGGTSILTDPLLRRGLGPLRRQAAHPPPELPEIPDVVLVSHLHRDHLDLPSLRRVPASTPLVVPRGASRWAAKAGADRIREIGRGETISVDGVEVTGVEAVHDGRRDRWGPEVEALGYLVSGNGRRVYFAGRHRPVRGDVRTSAPSTWRCCRSAGWGHLGRRRAPRPGSGQREALEMIRPRPRCRSTGGRSTRPACAGCGQQPLTDPPHEFARLARELAPEVEVRVLEPGSEMTLEGR